MLTLMEVGWGSGCDGGSGGGCKTRDRLCRFFREQEEQMQMMHIQRSKKEIPPTAPPIMGAGDDAVGKREREGGRQVRRGEG